MIPFLAKCFAAGFCVWLADVILLICIGAKIAWDHHRTGKEYDDAN